MPVGRNTDFFFSQAKPKTQIVYNVRMYVHIGQFNDVVTQGYDDIFLFEKRRRSSVYGGQLEVQFSETDCLCVLALFAPQLLTRIIIALFTSCNCMLPIANVMGTHLKLQFFYH